VEGESDRALPPVDPANADLSPHNPDSEAKNGADDLVALSRVSAAISGLRDLEAILRIGLNSVLDIMEGAAGGIMLLDEPTKTLSYYVYHGFSAKYAEEMCLSLTEGIAGKVAQSGRPVLLEDISSEPSAAHPELISMEGLRAFLSIPLQARGEVLGVMNVASHMPRRFTKRDMHLLHSIGDLLGTAIEETNLYERLRKARERYRRLARQTLIAQEEERRRLARELHDDTSQTLSGLALQLQALGDRAEMYKEVSRIIANLRPSLLDTLGLVPAIRQYAETSLRHLGISVAVEREGVERRLPTEIETELFRVGQVGIGNIVQHSKAKKATIIVEFGDDDILLRISDDGQGFHVSEVTDIEETGRGRGVFSIRERIGFLGGTAGIESQPGQGTTAWARVPISTRDEDAVTGSSGSG
jgi:signal transduction histidine kinase